MAAIELRSRGLFFFLVFLQFTVQVLFFPFFKIAQNRPHKGKFPAKRRSAEAAMQVQEASLRLWLVESQIKALPLASHLWLCSHVGSALSAVLGMRAGGDKEGGQGRDACPRTSTAVWSKHRRRLPARGQCVHPHGFLSPNVIWRILHQADAERLLAFVQYENDVSFTPG